MTNNMNPNNPQMNMNPMNQNVAMNQQMNPNPQMNPTGGMNPNGGINQQMNPNVNMNAQMNTLNQNIINANLTGIQQLGNDEISWTTGAFRQSVVAKIEEAISRSGMNTSRNSIDMENHVFQKAKTKEEYLGYVARLILHVREMSKEKKPGMGNGSVVGPGIDPINALQTLARQGSTNPPSGQLPQQLNLQQMNPGINPQQLTPQQIQQLNAAQQMNAGGPQPQMMPMGMPGQQQMPPNMMQPQQQNPQQPQMAASNLLQSLGKRMPMPNQMANMPGMNRMPMGAMQAGGGGGYQGQGPPMTPQMQQQVQRKQAEAMGMGPGGGPQFGPRPGVVGAPSQQYLGQSPNPTNVPSPAGPMGMQSSQLAASPAMVASPNPQIGPQRSIGMASSPSSSLNTPAGMGATPSPHSAPTEEQAYRDKVRQLSKYIEPLRRMIERIGSEDVNTAKMKKLLEILSNPNKRMPLDTLLKCEVVLEKMDFKRGELGDLQIKDQHGSNPLLETVGNHLHSPVINHTLQRTFGPTLEALIGADIKLLPPLPKKQKTSESSDDIPEALQGEIARLDQRFKVSLNPTQHQASHSINLICWLDDRNLPCVPPICLTVPDDYPANPPKCDLDPSEYGSTEFLTAVQKAFSSRIHKLRCKYSISQVLDTWEMAVRQASSPNRNAPITTTTILLGL